VENNKEFFNGINDPTLSGFITRRISFRMWVLHLYQQFGETLPISVI